ncbi:indigoidine synthase A-like protein [Dentipellis sp. KUC8613]|nr:indigoidine synthase A-like protein [Dentipellis sp. KUC8613]
MLRTSVRTFATQARGAHGLPASLARALDNDAPIDVHPEVEDALRTRKPIVALETTIITHGMPYPANRDTAQSVERNVRSTGAIPATIGLLGGRIKIGLDAGQLEHLADTEGNPGAVKLSRRDLGAAIALKKDGGTTCSTTLILAALAGIKVFATGGLGGVHRGGEASMDVSADLHELSKCPVGLVSAGVKSILDIGRTLEYLETLGVPVVTYGPTNDFPAFYSRKSGFHSPWVVNDPLTAANILHSQHQLGMRNGALFAAPIPEAYEAVGQDIQRAVEQAVQESEANGMSKRGKEVTPWLLNRVKELTQGQSLASNIALIENTSLIGGRIAVEYARMANEGNSEQSLSSKEALYSGLSLPPASTARPTAPVQTQDGPAKLMVIGSAAVDITARTIPSTGSDLDRGLHSTSPGSVSLCLGGVGRNMAEAAHRILVSQSPSLASAVSLVSSVGNDSFGRLLVDETRQMGMRTDGIATVDSHRSAVCNMVLDGSGNLIGGVADMDVIKSLDKEKVLEQIKRRSPALVALDANISGDLMSAVVKHCVSNNIPTFYEPTSVIKSTTILPAISAALDASPSSSSQSPITFASPNLLELVELYASARDVHELTSHARWWSTIDTFAIGAEFRMALEQLARLSALANPPSTGEDKRTLSFLTEQGIAQMAINLLPFFQHIVIKCGALGVVLVMRVPGDTSPWASERSNPRRRYIVAHGRSETVVLKHFPAHALAGDAVVNVTGAGDSLVGALLAMLTQNPNLFQDEKTMDEAVEVAQRAAIATLGSELAVSPKLSIRGST